MRQILSRSLLTVAAASSVLAVTGGYASADSSAQGPATGSPGILSGDSVKAPVDLSANACGNTVDAGAAVNPAFGAACATESAHSAGSGSGHSPTGSGASGQGDATGSPGVLSGDSVDIPVHAPVNVCGNTVDPLALLNPAFGNSCADGEQTSSVGTPPSDAPPPVSPPSVHHATPPRGHDLPPAPQEALVPQTVTHQVLAETGFSGHEVGAAGATSAALLLGGAMLYRRGTRATARIR
jgi:ChpA-C